MFRWVSVLFCTFKLKTSMRCFVLWILDETVYTRDPRKESSHRGIFCCLSTALERNGITTSTLKYICVIYKAWGQYGWIFAKSFLHFFRTRQGTRPIFSHLDWSTLVNKGFINIAQKRTFAGPTREIPSGKLGSQSERRIRFILPTRRLSHLIKGFSNWRSYYQMTLKQRRLWRTWLATGEQFPSKGDAMATVILLMRINEIS